MPTLQTLNLLAYLGALAATLLLAAVLTPASWWKRPNLLAACVLAGGTWGLGGLALQWVAASPARAARPGITIGQPGNAIEQPGNAIGKPGNAIEQPDNGIGRSGNAKLLTAADSKQSLFHHGQYVVHHGLNLRQAASTASARLGVVPAGAVVTTTGQHNGDWWQVSAKVGDAHLTGWTSSLWLRRAKETGR